MLFLIHWALLLVGLSWKLGADTTLVKLSIKFSSIVIISVFLSPSTLDNPQFCTFIDYGSNGPGFLLLCKMCALNTGLVANSHARTRARTHTLVRAHVRTHVRTHTHTHTLTHRIFPFGHPLYNSDLPCDNNYGRANLFMCRVQK